MGRRGELKLAYVHTVTDRYGRQHHYFRRHGIRSKIPGAYGSREFMEAYSDLLSSIKVEPRHTRTKAQPGTLAAVAQSYYASPNYAGLSPTSRKNYKRVIDTFLEKNGHRLIAQMKRSHVDAIIGGMSEKPGAGIIMLKRIRTLVRYGMQLGLIDRDPTAGATSYKSKEIHTWTEDELKQFETHWPSGSKQRLGYALLLYTGQRGSDVHRMTWADIGGDVIRVVQEKTGEKLAIPLHASLRTELQCTSKAHLAILCTEYGKPFSVKGFGQWVSSAIGAAGLPERCKAHGLRKAAARRLAEAGCTEKEIASITGHKTLAEVERYTRAASQELLARRAIEKQTGTEGVKPDPMFYKVPREKG